MPTTAAPSGPAAPPTKTDSVGPVHSLPTSQAPVPPPDFVPPAARDLLGSHPRVTEVAYAADVVEELQNFTDYDATFGVTVPASQRIAGLLDIARKWRKHRDEAAAWNLYVRAQDALAWKTALDLLDELKPAYKLAVAQRPALAKSYPRLATFFDTHKRIAERATLTKISKKKAKDAEAALAKTSLDASSSASILPAAPKSTESGDR